MVPQSRHEGEAASPDYERIGFMDRLLEPRQRLSAEISSLLSELEKIFEEEPTTHAMAKWRRHGMDLCALARSAARSKHFEAAWTFLLGASRSVVPLLGDEEKGAMVVRLRNQASKVEGWRRTAMDELLAPELPSEAALMEALVQADAASTNKLRALRSRRHELYWLLAIMIVSVASIVALFATSGSSGLGVVAFGNVPLVATSLAFGVIGACLSAAQRISRRPKAPVPDERALAVASLIRIPIGAGGALVVFTAAQAGLVESSPAAVLLGAFASGFSERYILRFVEDAETPEVAPPTRTPP